MATGAETFFPKGGGVCGDIVRTLDWESTPLGPIASWSSALKTSAGTVLFSPHPMILLWGPEFALIYNDAFLSSLRGERRDEQPGAMGRPYSSAWPDTWPRMRPLFDKVVREARASSYEDHLIPIRRGDGYEESYWTYSHSPVFDEEWNVAGVLALTSDTTARVLSERRSRTLRALVDRLANTTQVSEILPCAVGTLETLRDAHWDVPFAAAYDIGRDGGARTRRATFHDDELSQALTPAVCEHIQANRALGGWRATSNVTLPRLQPPNVPWPEPVTEGFIASLPKSATEPTTEVIVFGLSPRLAFDIHYRKYLEQLVATIANARVRHETYEVRTKAVTERRDLLRQAPVATVLLIGPEQVIEVANETFAEIIGRDVVGQTVTAAFPELAGTKAHQVLRDAYRTGTPFGTDELQIPIVRREKGICEDRWFKFNVQPIRDHAGDVYGMMAVGVDITEAVITRRTLEKFSLDREKLLQAAEAASRAKDEFLAMLGHELRNPLAPITTALHLMRLKEPNAVVREREIIGRQADHLVKLVDDLLDVSRVARGKVTLHRSRVAIGEVISRAVEIAAPLFDQKRHTLEIDVPTSGLDVDGDALRLGQVFANLMTNAAKYTEPGGHIRVAAHRSGASVVASVEDNGAGISPEQLPRLFDTFFQAPRSSDRAQGGLGLGLALVKSFVNLHGGTVTVSSNEGAGSIFEVQLPALPEIGQSMPDAQRKQVEVTSQLSEKRRVLLVDDSEDILEIFSTLLRYEGYEVMSAHDAPGALRIAPWFCPNVAVLDIGLPAMDGYDLARHLREELGEKAPKMIAMTGYGQESDRERARRAGFAAHLVKPVDPKELLANLRA